MERTRGRHILAHLACLLDNPFLSSRLRSGGEGEAYRVVEEVYLLPPKYTVRVVLDLRCYLIKIKELSEFP